LGSKTKTGSGNCYSLEKNKGKIIKESFKKELHLWYVKIVEGGTK
jgi:hypothetical protein